MAQERHCYLACQQNGGCYVTIRLAQSARASLAAHHLFSGEWADLLVWQGLEQRNVDYDSVMDRTDPIVRRPVALDLDRGRFIIDELGEQAFVQAVHSEDRPDQIIDILAWSASRPHLYGTYLGYAGLLGGAAVVNPASFVKGPCPIWAMPLAWLQSGLNGCVVLDAELAKPVIARAPGLFQCEDAGHARWLVESGTIAVDKLMVPERTAA